MTRQCRSAERARTGAKAQVKIVLICSNRRAEQDWDNPEFFALLEKTAKDNGGTYKRVAEDELTD